MDKIAENCFALDPAVSPVFEMDCSGLRGRVLARGRLYYRDGFVGRDAWVPFPDRVHAVFRATVGLLKEHILTDEKAFDGNLSHGTKAFVTAGGSLSQF
jgi:hypothetical protein